MLSRGEDYAHRQPSLTAEKFRRLQLAAGAPTRKDKPSGTWATRERMRQAEKQLFEQAQASYERTVRDWQAAGPNKKKESPDVSVGGVTGLGVVGRGRRG